MLFALICTDKPGSLDLRMKMRPGHLAYLDSLGAKLKLADPFTDDQGSPIGSQLVIDAKDRTQVQEIAKGDPFAKVGLFGTTEIRAWKWTIGNPET